jgi:hypothetical protein
MSPTIGLCLTLFSVLSCTEYVLSKQQKFELTLDYNRDPLINSNFTITSKLHYNTSLPIDCNSDGNKRCLVDIKLTIHLLSKQSNDKFVDIWCQPPAFALATINRMKTHHTCVMRSADASEQPTIKMIVNAHDTGRLIPMVTVKFINSSKYNIHKQAQAHIVIRVSIDLMSLILTISF